MLACSYVVIVYSCFEKGCLTNGGKLTRQCQKLLLEMVNLRLLDWTSRCFSLVEGHSTNTHIPPFLFLVAESPWTSIKQNQTDTTHNANRHCRVRFFTFAGQPLSKQLYMSCQPPLLSVHHPPQFKFKFFQDILVCDFQNVHANTCTMKV